jgi:hypothetical protein
MGVVLRMPIEQLVAEVLILEFGTTLFMGSGFLPQSYIKNSLAS